MRLRFILASVLGLFLSEHAARSQAVSATILGTVTDPSGAVIPQAQVTATESQTGISRRTNTNEDGLYTFTYLGPGTYRIEIEKEGFRKWVRENIILNVAQSARVDAPLQTGQVTETLNVQSDAPLLQTDRSDINRTVTSQQVRELPIANRSFQALVGLQPGVTPPTVDFTPLEDPQGTTFFRANGQGNSANNVQVDGVDNNNVALGLTIYIPPAENVREVNITTSNYNAEFGRAGGAVTNVITRSGTNEFHGSLFAFNRLDDLRARNFFNVEPQPKPSLVRNQFGGTLGGPIVRNKTFFFGSFQGTLERRGVTTTGTIPTAAMLQGDFSGIPGVTIYDPMTGNPDGTGRQPFAGNRIPQDRLNPITRQLLPHLPRPTGSGLTNNLIGNVPFSYDGYQYDGRVDHSFNERNTIFVKYNYSPYDVTQGSILGPTIGDGLIGDITTHTAIINYTRQWSPTLLMEARAGYNRYRAAVNGEGIDDPLGPSLGIANPNPDDISTRGLARFDISGMISGPTNAQLGIGTPVNYPLINTDNLFNFVNTWTKNTGRHTTKFGADIRRIRLDRFQPQGLNFGPRGLFNYNPGTTSLPGQSLGMFGTLSNSFAAFLLGAPDATSRTLQTITPTNRVWQAFFFVHDTWQVTSKLTLDLGIRYELHSPVKPRYAGGASNYDPATNSLLVAGIGNVDMATGVQYDSNNWAPRFGFAYRANDRTVIRGGYGISYYTGRFGFTGGTLSTQFPVISNVRVGSLNDFRVDGSQSTLPVVELPPIPPTGIISPAPRQGFFTIPFENPLPFVHSYNFTIQRDLGRNTVLDVAYVGTLGRRIPAPRDLNFALPGTGAAGQVFNQLYGLTASIEQRANIMNNNYDALQASLQKRFSGGLSFGAAYTYSKSLGVGDDQGGLVIRADIRRNYGPTTFDRRHNFVFNHIWELPLGKGQRYLTSGPAAYILGGWQIAGILRLATGTPVNITANAGPCNCPGNDNYADVVYRPRVVGDVGAGAPYFDPGAFRAPAPNMFGNAGRNTFYGPWMGNYDFSVFKTFPIRERGRLELRGEFYNVTNTPQFANPQGNVNSGTYAQVTSTLQNRGEREIQIAARLTF